MTGAVGEITHLKRTLLHPDLLWQQMMTSNDTEFGALLTAGIFPKPGGNGPSGETKMTSGLYAGHAYAVTAVKEVQAPGQVKSLMII